MEPFRIADPLRVMADYYPTAISIRKIAASGGEQARIALARLWLSEGIPFAFKGCPGIYESIRTWLGSRLKVNPKEISVTGSGRIGQSLSPKTIGKPFNSDSDLDIFIVSKTLFEKLRDDFNKWSYEFESGKVKPSNKRESTFWKDNNSRGMKLLQRGFMDSKMIPNLESYIVTKNISQTMWLLKEKLQITPYAPKIAFASVRSYESWDAYVRQTVLSLL